MEAGYTLFNTHFGRAGIAWGPRGLRAVALPGSSEADTVSRLVTGWEGLSEAKAPGWVEEAIRRITRHLSGEPQEYGDLPLDVAAIPGFHRRVYRAMRQVGPGRTLSYGEVAALVGSPSAARAVGQALARNPFVLVVPCHRVLAAGRKPGGFSAFGGLETKARLLELEGRPRPAFGPPGSLFGGGGRLDWDPEQAVRRLADADPVLARLMERVGPFALQLQRLQSTFEALGEAIIYQQLTGKAAATICGRVKALCGGRRFPSPGQILDTGPGALRTAGVSRTKALSLRDLAKRAAAGEVPSLAELRRLDDEEIIRRLDPIRGVGRWTVEMLLIFRLGRPDVLPATDYGLQKGFARVFGARRHPTPRQVLARGERWRPFRSVASWYLWRAAELDG